MTKFLVLCNHGNVRSACMAREIKDLNGPCRPENAETFLKYVEGWVKNEAIAIGLHANTPETIAYFCKWADKVIDMSDDIPVMQKFLNEIARVKYVRFDVGPDRWNNPFHPELRSLCQSFITDIIGRDSCWSCGPKESNTVGACVNCPCKCHKEVK